MKVGSAALDVDMKLTPIRKLILEAMQTHGRVTVGDLSEILGIRKSNLFPPMTLLHKKEHVVHIVGYRPPEGTSGWWSAIYKLGPGKDVERPKIDRKIARLRDYHNRKALILLKNKVKRGEELTPWTSISIGII